MDRVKNIEKMEKIMNDHEALLEEVNKVLDKLETHQKDYAKFSAYYSSEEWVEDFEALNNGELPEDLEAGILSEDGAYDVIGGQFQTAVRLIELANMMLQEHTNPGGDEE